MKICPKCKKNSPDVKLSKSSKRKDGLQYQCNACHIISKREWRKKRPDKYIGWYLQRDFGITYEQYLKMKEKQSCKCAICKKDESFFNRSLAVDHDHSTGKIRGLLCNNCNRGIGHLKESRKFLLTSIKYLEGKLEWQQ